MKQNFPAFLLLFFISLCLSTEAFSRSVPAEVKKSLETNHISQNALLYFWRPEECVSCVSAQLVFALQAYESEPEKIYFAVRSETDRDNLLLITETAGYKLKLDSFLMDEVVFKLVSKKNSLVLITGDEYRELNGDFSHPSLMKELRSISPLHLVAAETVSVPQRRKGLYYDFQSNNGAITCFNSQQGHLLGFPGISDTVNLYSKVSFPDLFSRLKLNAADSVLTMNGVYKSKLYGSRFVDFLGYVRTADGGYHFTMAVNYDHKLTRDEALSMKESLKKLDRKFDPSADHEIETVRSVFMLVSFDDKFNLTKCTVIEDGSGNFCADYYSPFALMDGSLYAASKFYPEIRDKSFKDSNYTYLKMTKKEDVFGVDGFSRSLKPQWFTDTKLYNDFIGSVVTLVNGEMWSQMTSYPSAVNLLQDKKIEMPLTEFNLFLREQGIKYNNKDNPPVVNLGLVSLEKEDILLIRVNSSKRTFAVRFDKNGNYLYPTEVSLPQGFPFVAVINGRIAGFGEKEITYFDLKED